MLTYRPLYLILIVVLFGSAFAPAPPPGFEVRSRTNPQGVFTHYNLIFGNQHAGQLASEFENASPAKQAEMLASMSEELHHHHNRLAQQGSPGSWGHEHHARQKMFDMQHYGNLSKDLGALPGS